MTILENLGRNGTYMGVWVEKWAGLRQGSDFSQNHNPWTPIYSFLSV